MKTRAPCKATEEELKQLWKYTRNKTLNVILKELTDTSTYYKKEDEEYRKGTGEMDLTTFQPFNVACTNISHAKYLTAFLSNFRFILINISIFIFKKPYFCIFMIVLYTHVNTLSHLQILP